MTFPRVIEEYVREIMLAERRPAYLIASADAKVVDCGGELELYGLDALAPGAHVAAYCLEGFIPHSGGPLTLPFIETDSGRFADIHVGDAPEGAFVLFLDASDAVERESGLQQRSNDLALLRERLGALRPEAGAGGDLLPRASRQRLTILALRLVVDHAGTGEELDTVQQVIRSRREAEDRLTRQGGLVETRSGHGVVGLFGALPSTGVAERAAVQAALDSFRAIEALATAGPSRVGAAAGIASGEVILGGVARPRGSGPIVVGSARELAERLARHAQPGELLIDEDTLEGTQGLQQDFEQAPGLELPPVYRRLTGGRA